MTRPPFNYTWIEQGKILAGSIPTSQDDIQQLRNMGVMSILSLTRRSIAREVNLGVINWHQSAIPDNGIPENEETTLDATKFISLCYDDYPAVYVHCRGGIGRTGLILIAYYVLERGLTLDQARELVKVRRNYEGNASAIDQGSPQREWIDALEARRNAT